MLIGGILLLDDREDPAAFAAHDSTVSVRIVDLYRQNRRVIVACRVDESLQRSGRYERYVTVEHEDQGTIIDGGHRLLHGMTSAELLGLLDPRCLVTGECRAHGVTTVAIDDHHLVCGELARRFEDMGEQWPAGERLENFGVAGAHTRPLAGGENDDRQ